MRMRDLLAINQHLNIWCSYGDCRRKVRWSAVQACERLGPDTTTQQAIKRLVCACGGRGKWGHLTVFPCTLDLSAWQAREACARGILRGQCATPEEELEMELACLRRLVGKGNELGGDGPVQWPVERASTGL